MTLMPVRLTCLQHLAPVALWNGTGSQLASCPIQQNLYFGIRDVRGLTDELAVTSSDGSLPDPGTCDSNSLEDVIADMKYIGDLCHDAGLSGCRQRLSVVLKHALLRAYLRITC